jgi:colanic acid/amylovoran biosynthesis protein
MKVLIINAYNRHNAGDASLLAAGLRHVRQAFPGADVRYAGLENPAGFPDFGGARNVGSIRRWVGVEDLGPALRIARKAFAVLLSVLPGPVLRLLARTGARVPALAEPLGEVAAIAEADLVVGLGGGYLNGARGLAGTLNVFFLCLPMSLASRLRTPLALAPQSYGPFNGIVQSTIARHCLNRARVVVAREDVSLQLLTGLGVRRQLLRRGVDSAFDAAPDLGAPRSAAEPVRVGITARAWLRTGRQERYERELADFVDWLQHEQGAHVTLLPQVTSPYGGDDDRIVARRVAGYCRTRPVVVDEQLDHLELRSRYAEADVIVGTRFHSVIFGLTSRVPSIAIAYEHKTTGIMRDLDLDRWVVPIESVTSDELQRLFSELAVEREAYLNHLDKVMPDYQARAADFVTALREVAATPETSVSVRGGRAVRTALQLARLLVTRPRSAAAAALVLRRRLTYLDLGALTDLATAAREIDRGNVPGLIVEAGTALGGSAIVLATTKSHDRAMRCYDVFGLIPPPSEHDGADVHARFDQIIAGRSDGIAGELYYGYRENLRDEVAASFARFGVPTGENSVQLVQGDFRETLAGDEPVALAHLDGDWYESTKVCLERLAPRVVPGGRMVIDDYDDWSGCRRAVDEFVAAGQPFRLERRHRLHLVRV